MGSAARYCAAAAVAPPGGAAAVVVEGVSCCSSSACCCWWPPGASGGHETCPWKRSPGAGRSWPLGPWACGGAASAAGVCVAAAASAFVVGVPAGSWPVGGQWAGRVEFKVEEWACNEYTIISYFLEHFIVINRP